MPKAKRYYTLAALATVAILVALAVAAQAKPAIKVLPKTIIGSWCFAERDKADQTVTFYSRGNCTADPKGVDVFATNYAGKRYSCVINRVERLDNATTDKEAYFVNASCVTDESGTSRWIDNSMFQLIGGQLIITTNFKRSDSNWQGKP
jgi:hypothetical protein